jgi:hypothetical protein
VPVTAAAAEAAAEKRPPTIDDTEDAAEEAAAATTADTFCTGECLAFHCLADRPCASFSFTADAREGGSISASVKDDLPSGGEAADDDLDLGGVDTEADDAETAGAGAGAGAAAAAAGAGDSAGEGLSVDDDAAGLDEGAAAEVEDDKPRGWALYVTAHAARTDFTASPVTTMSCDGQASLRIAQV